MAQALKIKRTRKAGSVEDALLIQWRALEAAQEVLYWAAKMGNGGGVLSASHAITQASTAYAKLIETAELQAQIDALKAELEQLRESARLRKVV